MTCADQWIAALLAPLSVWILASGIDDLAVALVCLTGWLWNRLAGRAPVLRVNAEQLAGAPYLFPYGARRT